MWVSPPSLLENKLLSLQRSSSGDFSVPWSPVSITTIVRRESVSPRPHTELPSGTAVMGAGAATGHEKELQGGGKRTDCGGKLPRFESHLVALRFQATYSTPLFLSFPI